MAVTLARTVISSTNDRQVYRLDVTVTAGDTTGTVILTNAFLLTDTVTGPLKDLFTDNYPDSATWFATFFTNCKASLTRSDLLAGVAQLSCNPNAGVPRLSLQLNLPAALDNVYQFVLDIEFRRAGTGSFGTAQAR